MSHSDVFVIGAGPAGLTAAYLLTKSGVPTTVIEADPTYVGGISRTASYKDFLFDIALHKSRPLMRCAAQSAEISSQLMPHTFSV